MRDLNNDLNRNLKKGSDHINRHDRAFCSPGVLGDPSDFPKRATGVSNLAWASNVLSSCIDVATQGEINCESDLVDAISFLEEFHPKDAIEGLLASKIVALHFRGMRLLAQTCGGMSDECKALYVNMATKLLRLENEAIEALTRYRNRGAQKYVVQHVNVEEGGKAIVGAVLPRVGGDMINSEETPHG